MGYLLLLVLLVSSLYAELPEASKENLVDRRENYFQTATTTTICPNVNPLTGDLIQEEIDFVVAGIEPLSIRRFYSHSAMYEPRYGGWRYNPETYLVANFEWTQQECFAAAGECQGSICFCQASKEANTFAVHIEKGFAHFHPSGQGHPLNVKISYHKIADRDDKHRFFWEGDLVDGSGAIRHFSSAMHSWLRDVRVTKSKTGIGWGKQETYRYTPNVWTPYQIPIHEERKPNGNILCYSYVRWKDDKLYPKPPLLNTITAYNSDKTKILGTINFIYKKDKHDDVTGITILGSDGRHASIFHYGKETLRLGAVTTPDQPPVSYGYQGQWINHIAKPEGRMLTTEYNPEGKVATQYAPLGLNGELCPIGRYEYEKNATHVYDAENNKMVYRYDDHKKIEAIELYQAEKLYRIERFVWDRATGNVLKKTIEDANGKPHLITKYRYDKHQNPIEERVGDGKEWRIITRSFSDDGFNLLLSETDASGKKVCFRYISNTNLLAAELTYEGNAIRKRLFHVYDDCAICIKTIMDDGSSEDPDNLQDVTYRKIKIVTPKQSLPCFGLPEIVEEKTIDSFGQELSLSKIAYSYASCGKILQEDHYDALGVYCYSIYNTYDEQERLISTQDPMGTITSFTYDANHNLTSISGPRSDQYREISYDFINRPVCITERQTDGSILITEKRYNGLGQVIEEVDTCKNSTYFEYNALGQVTAIYHPDGAIERKEYDILGNVIKETDAEGYETRKTYNAYNQPLSIYYPDGSEEYFSYDKSGRLSSHLDKNGATTQYTYDIFGHPIQVNVYSSTGQIVKTTSTDWTPFNKLQENDNGLITIYTYDFAGRQTDEQKAYQHIHYVYDARGRLTLTQNEETSNIIKYDDNNHIVERRTENEGVLQRHEKYAYDAAGNCTELIHSKGVTQTFFNTSGKPIKVIDALGYTTTISYCYNNTLTQSTTNPNGIQTCVTYDKRNREALIVKKNTQGDIIQQSERQYDKNGNCIQITHTLFSGTMPINTLSHFWEYGPTGRIERCLEAGEKETRYLYDSCGRLQSIIKPDGCKLQHMYDDLGRLVRYYSYDFDYHYTYDARDCLTDIYDDISKTRTHRTFDPLNNILKETLANGLTLTNTYDLRGRRNSCLLPDGSSINYHYRGLDLDSISRNGYQHTYTERNLEGQLISMQTPVGKIRINRDALGRYHFLEAPFFSAYYSSYDPVGSLLCYTYHDEFGEENCHYTYDDLDQLSQENDSCYYFDSLYNRLQKEDSKYKVNRLNQVTHDGEQNYTYDLCGNLISDGICRYRYDSLDRLISIEVDGEKTAYTYDPFHRRLSKTSNNIIHYLWDENNEIGVVDVAGDIKELRVLGEGLGAEIGAAILFELGGKSYVPIHDHRGCVVTLIDSQANVVECYRYNAFGEERTTNTISPWRFCSKRVDEETNLVYFGRRYYVAKLGRWLTQDPLGFDDGPNLYAYLSNRPLIDIDPYGLFSKEQWINGALTCCGLPGFALKFFGLGKPQQYTTFEDMFSKKSYNACLGLSELPIGEIGRTNGVLNREADVRKAALDLSHVIGGYNIHYTHNETHGAYDFHEAGMNLYRGVVTNPVVKIHERWDAFFQRSPPGVPYYEECHSQGTALVKNALTHYPKELRERIIVRAFCPSAYIPRALCKDVRHFVSDHDLVPFLDFRGRRKCADTITILPRHPKASRVLDHSISSPTFIRRRNEEITKYIELLPSYEKY